MITQSESDIILQIMSSKDDIITDAGLPALSQHFNMRATDATSLPQSKYI
jgi:hypothetical protein